MPIRQVPAGNQLPDDFNVIIEIPLRGDPVKYEVDKETGAREELMVSYERYQSVENEVVVSVVLAR